MIRMRGICVPIDGSACRSGIDSGVLLRTSAREAAMSKQTGPDSGRLDQILKSVDYFKPVATRRDFMQKMLLAGGSAAVAVASLGKGANVFASPLDPNPMVDFVDAAVGAARLRIAFYTNARRSGSPLPVA